MKIFWEGLGIGAIILAFAICIFLCGITLRSCADENMHKPFIQTIK